MLYSFRTKIPYNPMLNLYSNSIWGHLPQNISIRLIDESGNFIDPQQIKEVDWLSRFMNKCVVNKIFQKMVADKRSGVIEVYQDKVLIKDN